MLLISGRLPYSGLDLGGRCLFGSFFDRPADSRTAFRGGDPVALGRDHTEELCFGLGARSDVDLTVATSYFGGCEKIEKLVSIYDPSDDLVGLVGELDCASAV
jgi:hypothetical protein